jgi:CRISPR-associated endonuclease/helicase Cas3
LADNDCEEMNLDKILAKTPKDKNNIQYGETLSGHSECVAESFRIMFGDKKNETRLKNEWFRFFKLDEAMTDKFYTTGIAACYLHDIGKANNWFQSLVSGKGRVPQAIRHEHLSGLILWNEKIKDELQKQENLDYEILLSAVIGHHLKSEYENFANKMDADVNYLKIDTVSIKNLLGKIIKNTDGFNIQEKWEYDDEEWTGTKGLKNHVRKMKQMLKENNLLLAVRAALILADSAGSGLVRESKDIKDWLNGVFDESKIQKFNDIEEKILLPRIMQIGTKWKGYSDFQDDAEMLPVRALLIAPCGSGKTIAAWRWIKGRFKVKPAARVIFLYPTRATATEGFKDYVSWAPEADAALMHGTAEYELDSMFDNVNEEKNKKDFTVEDRLFAIAYWNKRIFSATVDQFLSFMQHSYKSMCLLPVLADSVVVIDEVHSFDVSMFSALKVFLKRLNVPVLCMTASLPLKRQEDLNDCGLEIYPKIMPDDLAKKAKYERYNVKVIKDRDEAEKAANKAIEQNTKVLWVVNTVKRCQELEETYKNGIFYHSRYKLDDRKERHKGIINAFKDENKPVMAITTQVCEMSLDLDADVLITEKAPITSLIQRMGRCNRHDKPNNQEQGQVFIYTAQDGKPYDKEDMAGVDEFLTDIDGKSCSQAKLEDLLEKYGPSSIEVEKYAAFFEDGFWAKSREEGIREEGDFTAQAILDNEIEKYLIVGNKEKPGYLLPVPRKYTKQDGRLGRWPFTVDYKLYNSKIGFKII